LGSDYRFPTVFGEVYGWNEGIIGLSYLGAGIGFFVGLILVGATNDRMVNHLTKKYGVRKPEYRMRVMMFFTPLVAIGMFWYGWSAEAKTHWIVPILGTVPIGIGMMGFFVSVSPQTALILAPLFHLCH
jgi:MFS family permease